MEFLVEIEVLVPPLMEKSDRDRLIEAERVRGRELTAEGIIRAIWRIPGRFANCAIWSCADATKLHEAISSLPMWPFSDVRVTPLAQHALATHCPGLAAGLVVE